MTLPVLDLTRGLPQDQREAGRFFRDLNTWIRLSSTLNGVRRVHALDQRFGNQIGSANKQSTQSVNPLSATDEGGGVAEIQVASHSVQYGFDSIAFNSGSISGLANSTLYYVYADDPYYLGGAVTYLATTNANIVTADSGRYYVGKITTPTGGGGGTSGGWGGGGGGGGNPLP